MDLTLLHPKIVHLPIALAVLLPLLSGGVLLGWWRGFFQARVWWLVVALQVILVGSGFAALQTGEIDEDSVERVVAEALIEAHEEAAQVFVVASIGVLALGAAAGFVRKEGTARGLAAASVVGTLVVLGLGFRVGQAGGDLVYRHGAAAAFTQAAPASPAGAAAAQPTRADEDDD